MAHIGGFFMGLKKSHRISNFLLHQIAYFCGQYIKKKPLKNCISAVFMIFRFVKVVPPGIEPGTQGFSVLCSTN